MTDPAFLDLRGRPRVAVTDGRLGVLARAAPQMNVFMLVTPVAMGARVLRCTVPIASIFSGGTGSSSHSRWYGSTARASSIAACTL